MADLIVLGLIPGTHIQITFMFWVVLVSASSISLFIWVAHHRRIFRNWIVTIEFMMLTRRYFRA